MIEIAPEFLEAVRGRQRVGVVAEVVLAELAGGVAEIVQELGDRRRAGLQIGRAAGKLRRYHAGAQRVHAGEEGVAAGGAALLGVVGHEDRAVVADAIGVGRFPDQQAATKLIYLAIMKADAKWQRSRTWSAPRAALKIHFGYRYPG